MRPDLHLSRLDVALHALIHTHRVATLGTRDAQGEAHVSMVPYALARLSEATVLVLHLSGLAVHTRHLQQHPQASVLVMQPEVSNQPVHALPRVTLSVQAAHLDTEHTHYAACRAAYLSRFPEAEPMTALPDFRFVLLHIHQARHIAGFGAARTIEAEHFQHLLQAPVASMA